jgi:hypothetical protein
MQWMMDRDKPILHHRAPLGKPIWGALCAA